ncbi:FtsK/SpoIIIE domain-containing protein [Pseudofrankia sp. DC12]|uniref:FtsK/SpoIIIE domain-containing protein n=1 Tax=Pseudofrankia sp. DC12 TaxID=683315 RepID=UPI0005F7F203|nr:FtsK/SpoIIIE domain-containing protein [Pseudofrankia sp. DC12]
MSGSRRARALATAVQSSLAAALAVADRLDAQAERLAGAPAQNGAGAATGLAPAFDEATELVYGQAPGLAGAGWSAAAWSAVATAPGLTAGGGFRPGLWRVGRVLVPGGGRAVPLALPLLDGGNLRVTAPRPRRSEAVDLVRGLLTRVLATVPPGRVELTVYDPSELGAGLAGFAPLRAARVIGPTLTARTALETAVTELSGHVGRITVDRLGGSFANLREREDAGLPRSEPWRLLVLLAWPSLPDESARALLGLAGQGPSCGVHVLAVTEPETPDAPATGRAPAGPLPNEVALSADGPDGASWSCSLAPGLHAVLDGPPPAELVAAVAAGVAAVATTAAATAPGLGALLPDGLWEDDSAAGIAVPVGFGPDGPCVLGFDDDTVHALVGGQAGAGKSTLLLTMIYGLAARYGPDQLRLHLLDFKEGLEFAQFGPSERDGFFLPHADTVGMDSDREFGVAVLRHVRAEMSRRAVAMRAAGARDLRGLRAAVGVDGPAGPGGGARGSTRSGRGAWPRILVVIDEFQVMLTPLDPVAREAVAHLEAIARQGRAYGIHLLLASQTLSGIDALDATAGKRGSIFGQFALRVALRTSISESRVLLSTNNEAAGALSGVGQAVVNRRNGHPAGNELIRVARPDPETLATLRPRLAKALAATVDDPTPPRVFVGHAPALLDTNSAFAQLRPGSGGGDPLAFVGAPLDLAPPAVGVTLSAQPGRNLAVLGPLRREAVGVLQAAVRSVAAQCAPGGLRVDLVAAGPAERGAVDDLAAALHAAGTAVTVTGLTGLAGVVTETAAEVGRREEDGGHGAASGHPGAPFPLRLLVLFAADAGRAALEAPSGSGRRTGLDDLRQAARRGPAVRVHVLGWWRSPSRLLDDLGPGHRDDFAAWVAAGVPGSELFALAGHRTVAAGTTTNRAVLFDRHAHGEPRALVPFAPLDIARGGPDADPHRLAGYGGTPGTGGSEPAWGAPARRDMAGWPTTGQPGAAGVPKPGRSGASG